MNELSGVNTTALVAWLPPFSDASINMSCWAPG